MPDFENHPIVNWLLYSVAAVATIAIAAATATGKTETKAHIPIKVMGPATVTMP